MFVCWGVNVEQSGHLKRRWVPSPVEGIPALAEWFGQEGEYIESTHPTLVPPPWLGSRIIVASDYGGSQSGSFFDSYSYLLTDWGVFGRKSLDALGLWGFLMANIRQHLIKDGRTVSFKDRKDAIQKRAEPHFLAAANRIPGVVATVLVDRTSAHLRMFPPVQEFTSPTGDTPADKMFSRWKPEVFERLMRIAWFGTTIAAGFASPAQEIVWMTDEDDIVANAERAETFGKFVAAIRMWLQPGSGTNVRVTRPTSWPTVTKRLAWEDLLSVADYAAGAVPAAMTIGKQHGHDIAAPGVQMLPTTTPDDILILNAWGADDRWPLKKWVFVVRPGPQLGMWQRGSVRIRAFVRPETVKGDAGA